MSEPIDSLYLDWLHAKVLLHDQPFYNYEQMIKGLHDVEYIWLVAKDDNRAQDGLDLRMEFLRDLNLEIDDVWYTQGCSVLEMLIGLSRRANFQTGDDTRDWFWDLISNLGLAYLHDDSFVMDDFLEIVNTFVWRTYHYDGQGGLFPLDHPAKDQREVQIWEQLFAYLDDHELD